MVILSIEHSLLYPLFVVNTCRYVAKLYLAESYIQMGSTQEALQHLTPDIVTDLEISRVPLGTGERGREERMRLLRESLSLYSI